MENCGICGQPFADGDSPMQVSLTAPPVHAECLDPSLRLGSGPKRWARVAYMVLFRFVITPVITLVGGASVLAVMFGLGAWAWSAWVAGYDWLTTTDPGLEFLRDGDQFVPWRIAALGAVVSVATYAFTFVTYTLFMLASGEIQRRPADT